MIKMGKGFSIQEKGGFPFSMPPLKFRMGFPRRGSLSWRFVLP
jgi:hypothetical protein